MLETRVPQTAPSRYMVINGDDFGYSSSVNRAIARAYDGGVLTSTSLMVTGDASGEAIALAKERPHLGVGLHLVLVRGKSVLPFDRVPHLVDRSGRFPDSPTLAGLRYQFQPEARRQLRDEIRAQLERFRQTGLPLSHVDGHLHLHTHPVVLAILAELAAEFGIGAIRLPSEELRFSLDFDPSNAAIKSIHAMVFGQLRRYGEGILQARGIRYADRVYGLYQTGKITESYLLGLIPKIEANRIEIYAHPSCDADGYGELAALLSDRVRAELADRRFALINYRQLPD